MTFKQVQILLKIHDLITSGRADDARIELEKLLAEEAEDYYVPNGAA